MDHEPLKMVTHSSEMQQTLTQECSYTSQKTTVLIYSTGKTSQVTQHLLFLSYCNCNCSKLCHAAGHLIFRYTVRLIRRVAQCILHNPRSVRCQF